MMRSLLIDNYDSYTYLIAQYLWKVNGDYPLVIKNDALSVEALRTLSFDNIIVSPGPGRPEVGSDIGLGLALLDAFPHVPMLGVCLGHQSLAYHYGGKIMAAPQPMHGKYSSVRLYPSPLFESIPQQIRVVRYHSLVAERASLPDCLQIIAETITDQLIMGLEHRERPWYGVQFHPESIGTDYGELIFRNFRTITERWQKHRRVSALNVPAKKLYTRELKWINPEQVFETLYRHAPYAFWLDSAHSSASHRYSYMGKAQEIGELTEEGFRRTSLVSGESTLLSPEANGESLLEGLRDLLKSDEVVFTKLPFPFKGGWVGYLNYEVHEYTQAKVTHQAPDYPPSLFMRAEKLVIFDHTEQRMYLAWLSLPEHFDGQYFDQIENLLKQRGGTQHYRMVWGQEGYYPDKLELTASQSKDEYCQTIAEVQQHIRQGESYELCLSNAFRLPSSADPLEMYKILRLSNPAPYAAYLQMPQACILSSSPECFFHLDKQGIIYSEPIKGTRTKGINAQETEKMRTDLADSSKDHAELLMITDLIRNDLGRLCKRNTIKVTEMVRISEFATVLQASSRIEGRLASHYSVVDVLKALFPGAPLPEPPS
ncbi:MAG: C26 family cysteine hydrolase domain-containing family [Bacteroidia bacterium]|nr:C26 family cysteine hydrolase domain-containing family [Bacteroidia bacterium]